jgi:hypothetical protein
MGIYMSIDAIQIGASAGRTIDQPKLSSASADAKTAESHRAAPVAPAPAALPEARQLQVTSSFSEQHLVVYRIVDKQTGDLIEQIPPEQFLELARRTQEEDQNSSGAHLNSLY